MENHETEKNINDYTMESHVHDRKIIFAENEKTFLKNKKWS